MTRWLFFFKNTFYEPSFLLMINKLAFVCKIEWTRHTVTLNSSDESRIEWMWSIRKEADSSWFLSNPPFYFIYSQYQLSTFITICPGPTWIHSISSLNQKKNKNRKPFKWTLPWINLWCKWNTKTSIWNTSVDFYPNMATSIAEPFFFFFISPFYLWNQKSRQ